MARNSFLAGGVPKFSRSKMYAKRAQHKRTKTVTKVEAKKASAVVTKTVKGDKNGGTRQVNFFTSRKSENENLFENFTYSQLIPRTFRT